MTIKTLQFKGSDGKPLPLPPCKTLIGLSGQTSSSNTTPSFQTKSSIKASSSSSSRTTTTTKLDGFAHVLDNNNNSSSSSRPQPSRYNSSTGPAAFATTSSSYPVASSQLGVPSGGADAPTENTNALSSEQSERRKKLYDQSLLVYLSLEHSRACFHLVYHHLLSPTAHTHTFVPRMILQQTQVCVANDFTSFLQDTHPSF
jgi:hypothetical protein